jgi:hypothetical protein
MYFSNLQGLFYCTRAVIFQIHNLNPLTSQLQGHGRMSIVSAVHVCEVFELQDLCR